jgi:hypothetical protein
MEIGEEKSVTRRNYLHNYLAILNKRYLSG